MSTINELNKVLAYWDMDKDNLSLCREVLMHYASLKKLGEAQAFLENLSVELNQSQELQLILGQSYLNCGLFVDARKLFESLAEDSKYFRSYSIALCFYFEQNFDDSIIILEQIVAKEIIVAPEINLLLARTLYQLGHLSRAFHIAKPLNFTGSDTHSEQLGLLAMLSLDQGMKAQAKDYAEQCLLLKPQQHDGLLAKASCLVFALETAEAINISIRGTQQFSNSGRFWSVLSQAQMQGQLFDPAYESICKATSLMPTHIGSWHIKGWLELSTERLSDAYDSFNSALSLNRNFADSHGGLAIVAFHQGKYESAESLAKIALRLDTNSFSGRYALSLLSRYNGDTSNSERIISDILHQESHIQGTSYSQLIKLLSQ